MSEEANVTFVGGKAIEQSEGLDSNLEADEREAAKAAVREAIEKAGKDAAETTKKKTKENPSADPFKAPGAKKDSDDKDTATEQRGSKEDVSGPTRGPDGKFLPRNGPKVGGSKADSVEDGGGDEAGEELPEDLSKASVKQLLKAREKVAALKKEAHTISQQQQEFMRQQAELQRQQADFYRQQAELQRQAQHLQALRKDPGRAIRELGYDPEQFILDLAQDGTPEGQARKQQQELQRQIQEMQDWKASLARQQQEYQQRQQMEQVVNYRASQVRSFLDTGMNEEKYPHIATFYKGNERALVSYGDIVAEEYRGLADGKEAGHADILDYIEDQLAERAKHWYTKGNSKDSTSGQKVAQEKTLPKSKGKSLNPDASGERRSMKAKDLKDLDGEERIEAAKQAVKVALTHTDDD